MRTVIADGRAARLMRCTPNDSVCNRDLRGAERGTQVNMSQNFDHALKTGQHAVVLWKSMAVNVDGWVRWRSRGQCGNERPFIEDLGDPAVQSLCDGANTQVYFRR